MRSRLLKKLTDPDCRAMYFSRAITEFDVKHREFLLNRIDWSSVLPEDIVRIRQKYDLTQEDLSRLIGVSSSRIIRWEAGTSPIPKIAIVFLNFLDRFGAEVFKAMDKKGDPIDVKRTDERPLLKRAQTLVPDKYTPKDVKDLRLRLKLSRKDFASLLNVTRDTVDKWERGENVPQGPTVLLFNCLAIYGTDILKK